MANILFLHAHPDDEAIFTGGTISYLAEKGHNISIVFATGGELGLTLKDQELKNVRELEARKSGAHLGAQNIEFLRFHDSGLDTSNFPSNAFAACDREEAANKLAGIARNLEINVMFFDDPFGIYGHPDHLACHEIGIAASKKCKVEQVFETTVDREYLHFVETHLVEIAINPFELMEEELFATKNSLGLSSVEITETLKIPEKNLDTKREAMKIHSSQIGHDSMAWVLNNSQFREVYGIEWFRKISKGNDNATGHEDIFQDIKVSH